MYIQEHIRIRGPVLAVSAGVLLLSACHPQMSEQERATMLRGLTDTHFRETTIVQDDTLDVVAQFSTENGLPGAKNPHDGYYYQHEFLRGFIDKDTGKRAFQLYFTISYPGPQRVFNAATYETPKGTQPAIVTVIKRSKSCERSQGVTYCDYQEDLGLQLDESLVTWIADRYGNGDQLGQVWHYKFTARSGADFTNVILPAEAKGLLERMQAHRVVK